MKLYTRNFKIDITSQPCNIYDLKTREHHQLYIPTQLILKSQNFLNPIQCSHAKNELNNYILQSI